MNHSTIRRAAAATLTTTILATALTGCATRAGYDEVVLYYQAGAGDNREFIECINPGTAGKYPIDDQIFSIPTSLRTWNIRREGGDTDKPIESGTKPGPDGQPGPKVVTYATIDFFINTDCSGGKDSPIVKFWESLGRRYEIAADGENGFDPGKFRNLLLNTIVSAEEKALAGASRWYTADELDSNTGGQRAEMEQRMAPLFAEELRAKLGGDFFCGIGYSRGTEVTWDEVTAVVDATGVPKIRTEKRTGKCPPVRISITDIDYADAGIAQARANVYKAEQDAKARLIAAQAELQQAELLGRAAQNLAYLEYKKAEAAMRAAEACKANSNCVVIIDTTGNGGAGAVVGRR